MSRFTHRLLELRYVWNTLTCIGCSRPVSNGIPARSPACAMNDCGCVLVECPHPDCDVATIWEDERCPRRTQATVQPDRHCLIHGSFAGLCKCPVVTDPPLPDPYPVPPLSVWKGITSDASEQLPAATSTFKAVCRRCYADLKHIVTLRVEGGCTAEVYDCVLCKQQVR